MKLHGIDLQSDAILAFCRKWRIREMEVFGSILRDDFKPDSDVDFLVSFEEGVRLSLRETVQMEDELAAIVGRRVDVVEHRELAEPDANPYRKAHILKNRRPIYGVR